MENVEVWYERVMWNLWGIGRRRCLIISVKKKRVYGIADVVVWVCESKIPRRQDRGKE